MAPVKFLILAATFVISSALAVEISVLSSGGNKTSGHQYGFLHEDINNSGDGGVYAELIRNRAFQYSERYPVSLDGWTTINGAKLSLKKLDQPLSDVLPISINVEPGPLFGEIGITNHGYWGMDVKKQKYTGSFWVKGEYNGSFTASLQSALTGETFGKVQIQSKAKGNEWVEHEVELVPTKDAPNSNNTFAITFDSLRVEGGSLDFNLISLFPPTYKGRKNGLRIDIANALEGMHPTFFRFPGGNMLEGDNNRTIWDWKLSLGELRYRPGFQNTWGYQGTYGLGLMEYLLWAEDMNLEMVLAVYGGMSLDGTVVSQDNLQPYIADALDQIEFIRGPVSSKWGAKRAELGHPQPFKLVYVEVGNEDWLAGGAAGWESYQEYRFLMFNKAIKDAYPDITVIASGATSDGHAIPKPAMGDYHPYREPDNFIEEFAKFDNEVVPHIVGEMASTHPNGGTSWDGGLYRYPWWIGSVGEAVGMISYERNADRVLGTFYAPIMKNENRWQWSITMLQYAADPAMTTYSTDWYVWELFAAHPLKETLPASGPINPLFYVAGKSASGSLVWKGAAYNSTDHADVPVSVAFEGVKPGTEAAVRMLTGPKNPYEYNDPKTGVNVVNTTRLIVKANEDGVFKFAMPELSVAVLDTNLLSVFPAGMVRREKTM